MQHAGDGDADFLADVRPALLDDHHRAVFQVADPLADLVALPHQPHRHHLAGQRHRLQCVGQLVKVDDLDALQLRDLVEVVVVGHHPGAQQFSQDHQAFVDLGHLAQLGQVAVVHLQIDLGVRLHPLEHVQPAPAAVALQLVGAIGDGLQLLKDETRHDELGVDEPRFTHIGNSAINYDRRVENQRFSPLNLLGEFHVGDDEAKFVLCLE